MNRKNHKPAAKPVKFAQVRKAAKSLSPASFDRGVNQVNWKKDFVISPDGMIKVTVRQTINPPGWNKLANKFTVRREGNYYVVWTSHRQSGFVPVATMHESGITGTNDLPKKFALCHNLTSVVIGDAEGTRVREAVSLAIRRQANYEIYKLYQFYQAEALRVEKIMDETPLATSIQQPARELVLA